MELNAPGVWKDWKVIVVQFATIFVDILVNQGKSWLIPYLLSVEMSFD